MTWVGPPSYGGLIKYTLLLSPVRNMGFPVGMLIPVTLRR